MRTQTIDFPDRKSFCIFPEKHSDLENALTELNLENGYPVIVLIGGAIDLPEAEATMRAIQTIAKLAHEMKIMVICGGTDMGVMAKIGQIRAQNTYTFPLIGITLEDRVTWPGGPWSAKFLWWGSERWQLEPNHPYFILVPGSHFGDESPWIIEAAKIFSNENQSVTILINGGEISRRDVQLSLEEGRPVIALSQTGRLADEISQDVERNGLINVISANEAVRITEAIQTILRSDPTRVTI